MADLGKNAQRYRSDREALDTNTEVELWLEKIKAARKEEEDWRDEAKEACDVFEAGEDAKTIFNIFHSNIKTQTAALYNSPPLADISVRHGEKNDVVAFGATIIERAIAYQFDQYDFHTDAKHTVQVGATTGRGLMRVKYIPHMQPSEDPTTGDLFDAVVHEECVAVQVPWDRWGRGPGRSWSDVTFIWFDHDLTETEVRRLMTPPQPQLPPQPEPPQVPQVAPFADPNSLDSPELAFGDEMGGEPGFDDAQLAQVAGLADPVAQLAGGDYQRAMAEWQEQVEQATAKYDEQLAEIDRRLKLMGFGKDAKRDDKRADKNKHKGVIQTIPVVEIWCRQSKSVIFLTEEDKEFALRVQADPLGLPQFFPVPRPIEMTRRNTSMIPLCPYRIYKPLLHELDLASRRIDVLMRHLRVRAIGDPEIRQDLDALANAQDGTVVSASSVEAFGPGSAALKDRVMWWPIDMIIAVVRELASHREQLKQQIYEVTGISDVLRGATDPNETLGAQQLKASWGSQRINDGQEEVARHMRDIIRIKAAIICSRFSERTLANITGLSMDDERWQPAMQLLRGYERVYAIDIETDSTIRGDAARDQEQWRTWLDGTAAFANAAAGLAAVIPSAAAGVVGLYGEFAKKMKLGKRAAEIVDRMVMMAEQQAAIPAQPAPGGMPGRPGQQPQGAPAPQQGQPQPAQGTPMTGAMPGMMQ